MAEEKVTILLVEDEADHAELLRRAFAAGASRFRLRVVNNLREARAVLAETVPQLVIADLVLPDGRGLELLAPDKETAHYPVILLTAHGDEKVAVEAMKAGASDYVVKSKDAMAIMPRLAELAVREWGQRVERKKAEEELRRSEAKVRAIFNALPDLLFILDRDGNIREYNAARATDLFMPPETFLGKPVYAALPDWLAEMTMKHLRQVGRTGEVQLFEYQLELKGNKRDFEARMVLDTGDQVLCLIRDITRRKRDEEALREADQRKEQFLAMLAHELRNPLSPIGTSLELIRNHPDTQAPQVRRWVETIGRQVGHLTRIVDDLLDTSRISRGLINLQKETVLVSDAVAQAVEINRSQIEAKRQDLEVDAGDETLVLDADPVRLVQILSNLLNNASKYSPEGSRIDVAARREETQAVIAVRDNGMGISESNLARIFDMFYQADTSLARTKGGLGLGLMLVQQLTRLHGGTVTVESAGLNRGSVFTLHLPLSGHAAAASVKAAETETIQAQPGMKVLVVEDNPDSAESLGEVLQSWGYQVWLAQDGAGGIEEALKIRPEVVLLDIGLPGMDGYETARRLRREETLSQTALFALTGYNPDPDRSAETGFRTYFTKPVDLDTLERELRAVAGEVRR